jgi:hypothetical protein
MFEDLLPMVGYAATARLRSGSPPMTGGSYHDRTDWWQYVLQVPPPRIIVLQDVDQPAGVGASVGDVHAAILRALGCVGFVTQRRRSRAARCAPNGVQPVRREGGGFTRLRPHL